MAQWMETVQPKDAAVRRNGPLQGIRVLDLSRVLSGPFCTKILADLGADVVKIEEMERGDSTRAVAPFVNGMSHYYIAINHNKRSVGIDARTLEGRDVILDLAKSSDVVIENFRPGVRDRLGLSVEKLREANPSLIVCSISGFGQRVSAREKPCFDIIAQAMSGLMSVNGDPAGEPMKVGVPLADLGAGLWAAIGVLSALHHRNATGEPLEIDLSMLDGLIALLGYIAEIYLVTGESPGRPGNMHHSIVPYGLYPVKDGNMVLALHHIGFWEKFCKVVGRTDLFEDERYHSTAARKTNRNTLEPIICEILRARTADEWHAIFDPADVPHGVVNNIEQALTQPLVRERNLIKTVEGGACGPVQVIGTPLQFVGAFNDVAITPPAQLGEHTRSVLRDLLRYDDLRIDGLIANGVISADLK